MIDALKNIGQIISDIFNFFVQGFEAVADFFNNAWHIVTDFAGTVKTVIGMLPTEVSVLLGVLLAALITITIIKLITGG